MLTLLSLPAFAALNYGVAVGGAGSLSVCGLRTTDGVFRASPSANAFVGARWKRSEWFIGLSTAWGVWYGCGSVLLAHYQVIQTGYLHQIGAFRLGGYLGVGNSWLGAGVHLEHPFVVGPVELAPAVQLAYNAWLTVESHLLLRVTPARKRRSDAPTEDAP